MLVLCSQYFGIYWYITFLLKSTAIYKVKLYTQKNEYLACQRQNIFHSVLWLEGQCHSLAITEVNICLCFPSILLLDALWHWAVDIQKVIDLLLETRKKYATYVDIAKTHKSAITLALCYESVFRHGTVYLPMTRQGQSSVTCSLSLLKTWLSWEWTALPLHSHHRLLCLYLILIANLTQSENM